MKSIKELETELKAATKEIKYLESRKREPSFKKLSAYSTNLFNEEYKAAVGKQMDILMEMVETGHPQADLEKIVSKATKMI